MGDGTPADDFPLLVQRALTRYVGGQLLFSIVMGTTAGLALYLFGVLGIFPAGEHYAIIFGIFFGLMELIPYIGPVLGALPPVLVALFNSPLSALWVTLLFVGLQQAEGHIVAPQIFGHTLRINPILVILALLLGPAAQRLHRTLDCAAGARGGARDGGLPLAPPRARTMGAHGDRLL